MSAPLGALSYPFKVAMPFEELVEQEATARYVRFLRMCDIEPMSEDLASPSCHFSPRPSILVLLVRRTYEHAQKL